MAAAGPRSSSDGGPASRGGFTAGGSSNDRDGPNGGNTADTERERDRATFECNICLDTARDAVISMCGHLFWYETEREKGGGSLDGDYCFIVVQITGLECILRSVCPF